jgi:tetrapyrrole methylase family protein/MazG family protein
VVSDLRSEGGCPWDRAQTHESLRPYVLEETAEVLEALDAGDPAKLREELGDLLFQVLIHARLAEEAGHFTVDDVIEGIASKLVRRHPHVFGESDADTPEAVVKQWDELKAEERGEAGTMAGIPPTLPSLALAQAVQRRAARAGFEWEDDEGFWKAVEEEMGELRDADESSAPAEAGDLLFAAANLARWRGIDAEDALRVAVARFEARFERVEGMVDKADADLRDMTLKDKLALWDEAKLSRSDPDKI